MPDNAPPPMDHLPELERALRTAQEGFRRYNRAAFPERSAEFFALELAGEAGEIANNEKRIWKGREVPPEKLADEAADVFIAVVNYANARGIDLAGAVSSKLHEIERRRLRDKQDDLPL